MHAYAQPQTRRWTHSIASLLAGVLGLAPASTSAQARPALRPRAAATAPARPAAHDWQPTTGLLDLAEAAAAPANRVAVASLREMRADPAQADAILASAVRHIKAVRREHASRILDARRQALARLQSRSATPADYAGLELRTRTALDSLRRTCRRTVDFVHVRRLALGRP